jgi:hypothetical protein
MVYTRNVSIFKVINLFRRDCTQVSECCTVDRINLLANMIIPKLVVGNTLFITQSTERVACVLYQIRCTPMNNSIDYPLEFFLLFYRCVVT